MAQKIIILFLMTLGVFWRFYQLEKNTNGMYVDETVIGYNAYSLAVSGRDEYGMKWPVFLRSFGAFSSPLYTYVTAGVIKLNGMNNFSVRFASAFFGSLMMVWFYLILQELGVSWSQQIAGVALMALSPWTVFLSRMALEGHMALSLMTAGVWMFLKTDKDSRWWIGVASMVALSSWTYQAARPISYGLMLGFLLIRPTRNRWAGAAVGLFGLSQIPQLMLIGLPAFSQRGVGLFYTNVPDKFREFWSQAMAYFSPLGLYWRPDEDPQRSLPALSNFYPFLVILYLFGWLKVKEKMKKIEGKLWLLLLMVGVAVPALTKDPFSSVRGQFLIIPLMLMLVWGEQWWEEKLGKKKVISIFLVIILISQLWLWRSLIVLLPYERAAVWGYGYEQLADQIKQQPSEHWLIEQTRQTPVYIQLLYYLKYPPVDFQSELGNWSNRYYSDTNYDLSRKFGNVEVRDINWKEDVYKEQIMVGDDLSISTNQIKEHFLDELFVIKDPTGKILFRGYRTNPVKKRMQKMTIRAVPK